MKCFKKVILLLVASVALNAEAGMVEIGPVYLDSVGVIVVNSLGHKAGNLEIKITNGTGSPAGVTCDSNYITTKSDVTNFQGLQ